MVDQAKCDRLISHISSYLAVLDSLRAVPLSEFLKNPDKIGNAKYHFIVGIEACIDLSNHIIASERFRIPQDNADSFTVLAEQSIIPEGRIASYMAMARFRNRLVHIHWDTDDKQIWEYLQDCLDDLRMSISAVSAYIDED